MAGDVLMNLDTHEATRAGERLDLTVKEFELLRVLLERAGKLVKPGGARPRGLGPGLVRLNEDAGRPRQRLAQEARRRPRRAAVHPHRPWRRLPLRDVSFRARLVLAAAYLLAAVVIALAVPLALSVDRRATSELESDVVANGTVLSGRIADLVRIGATNRLAGVVDQATVGEGARTVVVDENGVVLADSEGAAVAGEQFASAERPEFQAALAGGVDVRRRRSDTLNEDLLLVTVPVTDRGGVIGALRVSAPLGEVESSVRSSWLALALIGVAVVGAGLVLAWILAGSVARPVEKLRAAAGRVGRGDLDARVEPEGPQEIDELGRSFNRMAGELSSNLAAQRDFVANASHQLRTPLTGIKLRLEAIRGQGGGAADEAAKAEAELDRLSALVDDLLALARAASRPGDSRERRPRRGRARGRPALGGARGHGRARALRGRRGRRAGLGGTGGRR